MYLKFHLLGCWIPSSNSLLLDLMLLMETRLATVTRDVPCCLVHAKLFLIQVSKGCPSYRQVLGEGSSNDPNKYCHCLVFHGVLKSCGD